MQSENVAGATGGFSGATGVGVTGDGHAINTAQAQTVNIEGIDRLKCIKPPLTKNRDEAIPMMESGLFCHRIVRKSFAFIIQDTISIETSALSRLHPYSRDSMIHFAGGTTGTDFYGAERSPTDTRIVERWNEAGKKWENAESLAAPAQSGYAAIIGDCVFYLDTVGTPK